MKLSMIGLLLTSIGWLGVGYAQDITSPVVDSDTAFQFMPSTDSSLRLAEQAIEPEIPDSFDKAELLGQLQLPDTDSYWLGSFTYGDVNSRRVAMLVHETQPPTLYVDLNRDQKLTPGEQIESTNPNLWNFGLDAEYLDNEQPQHHKLQVQVRWAPSTRTLKLATAGSMQGTVQFQGHSRLALYEDRNANGCWFDLEDRVFVDLNGDGKIDSITERLSGVGLRQIGGVLYGIGGDRTGQSLAITEIRERGQLLPRLTLVSDTAQVLRLSASLVSQQGIRVEVKESGLNQPVEVPVGDWHVAMLELEVKEEQQTYYFRFASLSAAKRITTVKPDEMAEIELLGLLNLSAKLSFNRGPQTDLIITPTLYSESGMYLIMSRVGQQQAVVENRLRSASYGGTKYLGAGTSGFL